MRQIHLLFFFFFLTKSFLKVEGLGFRGKEGENMGKRRRGYEIKGGLVGFGSGESRLRTLRWYWKHLHL